MKMINQDELARMLKISRDKVRMITQKGQIPFKQKPGHSRIFYVRKDVIEWLKELEQNPVEYAKIFQLKKPKRMTELEPTARDLNDVVERHDPELRRMIEGLVDQVSKVHLRLNSLSEQIESSAGPAVSVETKEVFSTGEIAKILKTGSNSIIELTKAGKLRAVMVGERRRYLLKDVIDALDRGDLAGKGLLQPFQKTYREKKLTDENHSDQSASVPTVSRLSRKNVDGGPVCFT